MEGVRLEPMAVSGVPKAEQSQPKGGSKGSFEEILMNSLEEVNDLQRKADEAIRELATGEAQDLHRTMVLMEKAELSLKLMVQVRNKLLDAYQEMMRMPI